MHEQALALDRAVCDRGGDGFTITNLAHLQLAEGRIEDVRTMF